MSVKWTFVSVVMLAVAAACGSTPTSPAPTPIPPIVFTYTMVGMPDGTGVLVIVTAGPSCTGASSNGQMRCSVNLTPGRSYTVTAHNSFTGQDDCNGLTVGAGTLSVGTGATGCPALFQDK